MEVTDLQPRVHSGVKHAAKLLSLVTARHLAVTLSLPAMRTSNDSLGHFHMHSTCVVATATLLVPQPQGLF